MNNQILNKLALEKTEAKFANQYKGILFNFSGRLKGAQRAKKMQLYYGKISTQTFNSSIKFSQKQIFTK
jgi:ribosomal protein S3